MYLSRISILALLYSVFDYFLRNHSAVIEIVAIASIHTAISALSSEVLKVVQMSNSLHSVFCNTFC